MAEENIVVNLQCSEEFMDEFFRQRRLLTAGFIDTCLGHDTVKNTKLLKIYARRGMRLTFFCPAIKL